MATKVSSRALPDIPNKPGVSNWVEKAGGLPKLIERVAKHLRSEKGYATSRAIATAVNWAKKMCATGRAFGGHVKVGARAQAAACKAVAAWNVKRGKAKLSETITLALVEAICEPDELDELREALALLEAGPESIDAQMARDLADLPLEEIVAGLEAEGELVEAASPLDLEVETGNLALLEAPAKKPPLSHARRRSGESLGAWGSRLKRGDRRLARAAEEEKKRDGSAKDADFEKKHPRGRGGKWTIKMGQKGDQVREVQRQVGAKDDGEFGDETKRKVMAFQRRRGLAVDGVVGRQTLAEMRKRGAGKKVRPGGISRKRGGKLVETPAPTGALALVVPDAALVEAGRMGRRGLPGGGFDPNQPRDRLGRWREMVGKLQALKVGGKTKIGSSFEVEKVAPDGPRKYRVTMKGAPQGPGKREQRVYVDTAAEAADAAMGKPKAEDFEERVSGQVAGMKGASPEDKGTSSWRRQAFLTVRTALGRKNAGIEDLDEDWRASLDWWEKKGRTMLADDPEMLDYMAGFSDTEQMVREARELRDASSRGPGKPRGSIESSRLVAELKPGDVVWEKSSLAPEGAARKVKSIETVTEFNDQENREMNWARVTFEGGATLNAAHDDKVDVLIPGTSSATAPRKTNEQSRYLAAIKRQGGEVVQTRMLSDGRMHVRWRARDGGRVLGALVPSKPSKQDRVGGVTGPRTYSVTFGGVATTRRTEATYTHAAQRESGKVTFHKSRAAAERAAGRFGSVKPVTNA